LPSGNCCESFLSLNSDVDGARGTSLKWRESYCARTRIRKETTVRKPIHYLLAGALLASGAAIGKLPQPTPEEQAAVAAKKEKEKELLEKEKAQLERAQDRIASRYRKEKGGGPSRAAGKTSDQNMPKTTSELPGGAGPTPARPQSGEAHSAPAK
jgi:hypothetical protein